MAVVLAASCPLGDTVIVQCRDRLRSVMFHLPSEELVACAPSVVRHSSVPILPLSFSTVYVGCGVIDSQSRPSPWANPYVFLDRCPEGAYLSYSDYVCARADLRSFLTPLAGKTLLCDCNAGDFCHANVLAGLVDMTFGTVSPVSPSSSSFELPPEFQCAPEDQPPSPVAADDDDPLLDRTNDAMLGVPLRSKPHILADVSALNETVRGRCPDRLGYRPGWPAIWLWLITCVRSFAERVMWEVFSGMAGLTHEFHRQGWACAPPIDILYHEDCNCLEAGFICILIGLILERRVRVLHLGPPLRELLNGRESVLHLSHEDQRLP